MYGSSFCTAMLNPRSLRSNPIAAAVTPFPTDETTPPVKNKYFVVINHLLFVIAKRVLFPTTLASCASAMSNLIILGRRLLWAKGALQ
jgi:hypothetical protein